jgi:alkylresorcinol/alkylpyrone synthase
VLAGERHPLGARRPRVVDSLSVFFPDTERVMGWDVIDTGFKVVLSPDVPRLVREQLRPAVERLLAPHALSVDDVAAWIAHPGGPKVMDAMQEALELDDGALEPSRRSLAEIGNVSSASVLFILAERLRGPRPPPGAYGVLVAMGPAFCAELVLLRW